MNGFGEDLLVGGYLALPGLENSNNPDVARFARSANEISTAVIRWAVLLEVLKWVSVAVMIPYWLGSMVFLTGTGITGLFYCLLLLFAAIGVPILAFNRNPVVQSVAGLALLAGGINGLVYLFG